jgi:hypothetical protein
MGEALRKQDDSQVDALLSSYALGVSVDDAAAYAGVTPQQLGAWKKDPEFDLALRRARTARKIEWIERFLAEATAKDLLSYLERIDPSTFAPPQIQLNQVNVTNNTQINVNELALRAAREVQAFIANGEDEE